MKILISIQAKYAFKILEGSKRFEFRKTKFTHDVKTALIYITMPYGKIFGEFEVKDVIVEPPSILWEITKDHAGVNKQEFNDYFSKQKLAVAIEIGEVIKYKSPLYLHEIQQGLRAPQSFSYLTQ